MKPFLDVVLLQDGIIKLHLHILFVELPPDGRIAHRRAAGNQRLHLADYDLLAHVIFEGRRRQVMLLQQPLVLGLANEGSSRKEDRGIVAVLQFVLHFFWSRLQPQVLRLVQQRLPPNQLVDRPLSILLDQKGQQHRRVLAVLLRLLFRHLSRCLAHLLHGNVLTTHLGNDSLAGRARQVGAQPARDQRDRHGPANQQQQPAKHNFLDRSLSLQKSNHFLIAPEVCRRITIIN